jgi:hypothetical protein
MRFCKDCGTVLGLFGEVGRELCSACVQLQKKPPPPAAEPADSGLLADAVLSHEAGKIVLRAKEGWELWSGPEGSGIKLGTLLARAERIYRIRLRRQKN